MSRARKRFLDVPSPDDVVAAVNKYLTETGTPEYKLGQDVCNDPNLVREIRGGRKLSLELAHRLSMHMGTYRA